MKLVALSPLELGMGCTIVLDPIGARVRRKGFDTLQKIAEDPREREDSRGGANGLREAQPPEVVEGSSRSRGTGRQARRSQSPFETNDQHRRRRRRTGTSIFQGSPMRAKFRTNQGQNATVSIDAWR